MFAFSLPIQSKMARTKTVVCPPAIFGEVHVPQMFLEGFLGGELV